MNAIKSFFKGTFYIFLYFIITVLIYLLFGNEIYNTNDLFLANIATIVADLTIVFIFIIIFRKTIIPDFNDFKKNYKKYIKDNIQYWLIGLFLMIISNILISFLVEMPTNEEVNRELLFNSTIPSIISMVIVAPILEELITRKSFKDVFKNQYIYIFISGLIFGSLHLLVAESLIECLYIIPYGVLGCAFAKIYYNTNNIWSNIFFHALHNFIAILLIFTGV